MRCPIEVPMKCQVGSAECQVEWEVGSGKWEVAGYTTAG
jgi:hypothetical protein